MLAGDFNCLAPSDDRALLSPVEAALYPENASPIIALYDKYRPLVGPDQSLSAPWRTYKPWTGSAPDRAIDHIFLSDGWDADEKAVVRTDMFHSDHQPIVARLTLEE